MPAPRRAAIAASFDDPHCSATRPPASRLTANGPADPAALENVASRIRKSGIRAVSFGTFGQHHYTTVPSLSNTEVAQKLLEIRTLMEMAGDSFYKYTAYEKAAASIENAPPLADLVAAGEHLKLPGIGKSIGAVVEQLVRSGTSDQLDELHERFPPTLLEVLGVAGIGTKTAAMLFTEYGIASLADLESAIASGALAERAAPGQEDDRELETRHPRI